MKNLRGFLIRLGCFIIILAAGLAAASQILRASEAPQFTANDLIQKSVRALRTDKEIATYEMKLIGQSGEESRRKMKVWFKSPTDGDAKFLIKFSEPASMRGTGFLTLLEKGKPADQWLYVPAYNKTRRIRKGNENESFLGSDFTMADISVEKEGTFEFRINRTDRCGDSECYVLIGTPKAEIDKDSMVYSRKVLFIRKDNFLNVRSEFYNLANQLEKVMELQGLHKDAANRWMADRMEMQTIPSKHRTVLEFQSRDVSTMPDDHFFTQSFLERT